MKRLFLVRHGKAEESAPSGSDFDRMLKKRGHNDARLIAAELKSRRFEPTLIITSPAIRAKQTSDIFAANFLIPSEEILEAPFIFEDYTMAEFLDGISALTGSHDSVMVVGHNPDIAKLAVKLTNGGFININFPTAASAVISFDISSWHDLEVEQEGHLEAFLVPRQFKEAKVRLAEETSPE